MKPVIVVNQDYEVLNKETQIKNQFPHKQLTQHTLHQSYATVIEQSLTTKDKQIVREILSYDSVDIVNNTIIALSPAKVTPLLEQLELVFLERPQQTLTHSLWMSYLLRHHLGHIINNPINRQRISRMRKIIQKRISMKAQIQTILQNISLKEEKYEKNMVFEPKFHYIEKEVEDNGMEEENEEEGMQFEDFDEEDLDQYM